MVSACLTGRPGAASTSHRNSTCVGNRARLLLRLPPLLDHEESVPQTQRGRRSPGSLHVSTKIGRIPGGPLDQYRAALGNGDNGGLALVADARRRAHRDVGALRPVRVPAARIATSRTCAQILDAADRAHRADAEPRRRRALPAPQRAGHRHQPRRPAAADAGRPLAEGTARPANPRVGFNLHNQSWRTSVGKPPKPASISLLSVAYDEPAPTIAAGSSPKRLCAVIRDALEPLASGQIGRYDDEFEVRAFGDNLTKWGTPVVLIETGPWPPRSRPGARAPELRRHLVRARRVGHGPRGRCADPSGTRAADERIKTLYVLSGTPP